MENGGTVYDKYAAIDSWTCDRFVEARAEFMHVKSYFYYYLFDLLYITSIFSIQLLLMLIEVMAKKLRN